MSDFVQKSSGTSLTVNLSNDAHYVVERSEAQGIEDLRKLADKAGSTSEDEKEEAWVFVEGKVSSGQLKSFWFEIGHQETPGSVNHDPDAYEKIAPFLNDQGVNAGKIIEYHYHPADSKYHGEAYLPSANDLSTVAAYNYISKIIKVGVPASSAIVTARGIWRMEWQGPEIRKPEKVDEYQNSLRKKADQAWSYHNRKILSCSVEQDICREYYKYMAQLFSNGLMKVGYQPFPTKKTQGAAIQAIEGSLLTAVTGHQEFFDKIKEQINKENKISEEVDVEIKFSDPESVVTAEVQSNGDRWVQFHYVIDNNSNPRDGRVNFTDTFVFSKNGKYKAKKFTRNFTHPRIRISEELPFLTSNGSEERVEKYRNLGKPETSQQKSFAGQVARSLLPKLSGKSK